MDDKSLAPHRFRQGRTLHEQGKLTEAIAEYEVALTLNPNHFDSVHFLGLAFHQAGDTKKAIERIRQALNLKPDDLGALTNCGEICRAARMSFEAEVHLNLAVALYPAAVEARVNLAALYLQQGRTEECREILRQARELKPEGSALMRRLWALANGAEQSSQPPDNLAEILWTTGRELTRRNRWTLALPFLRNAAERNPNDPSRWLSLGIAYYDRDDKLSAIDAFTKAAKLDPSLAVAFTNIGNAQMERGDEAAAEEAYAAAAALAPDEPLARFNQSLLLLKQDQGPEAWALYDYRHRLPSARQWPGQRWTGEAIKGKRLLVHCEQGAGDTLQFLRFLTPLRREGAHITLAAQTSLSRLCSQVEGVDDFLMEGRTPEFDVRIELLSLPHMLGTTPDTLPPPTKGLLLPRDHKLARQANELSGRKVGLCWAGATSHKNDWRRSAPLGLLAALRDIPGVQLVSLQIGARAADIAAEGWNGRIHDWTANVNDFADTAALIEALDIVITVDTAVAHLAATLGKPTWVMLPNPGEWRWGKETETTVWYPTARLFRQTHPFDWDGIARRIRAALGDL